MKAAGCAFLVLAVLAGGLAGSVSVPPAGAAKPYTCAVPTTGAPDVVFKSRDYKSYTLLRGYIRPTLRVGLGRPWVCQDAEVCSVGTPVECHLWPPTPAATIRLWAIRGISPRLALSRGGSSRKLLVASGTCAGHRQRERRLLRCLRAWSEPGR